MSELQGCGELYSEAIQEQYIVQLSLYHSFEKHCHNIGKNMAGFHAVTSKTCDPRLHKLQL
jgi:hypothetical protein